MVDEVFTRQVLYQVRAHTVQVVRYTRYVVRYGEITSKTIPGRVTSACFVRVPPTGHDAIERGRGDSSLARSLRWVLVDAPGTRQGYR